MPDRRLRDRLPAAPLGYRQIFLPLRAGAAGPMATREYFPRAPSAGDLAAHPLGDGDRRCKAGSATAGAPPGPNSTGSGATAKGWSGICSRRRPTCSSFTGPPVTSPISYRLARGTSGALSRPGFRIFAGSPSASRYCRPAVRARSAARIYGWRFAAAVPIRMFWGNLVNFAATATALWEFWSAHVRGIQPPWRKTDHVYPVSQPAMATGVVRFHPMPDVSPSVVVGESY